jgi:hypothetical protein
MAPALVRLLGETGQEVEPYLKSLAEAEADVAGGVRSGAMGRVGSGRRMAAAGGSGKGGSREVEEGGEGGEGSDSEGGGERRGGDAEDSGGEGSDGAGGDGEEVDRFDVQASTWLLRKMISPITGKAPTFAVNGFGAPQKARKIKLRRADGAAGGEEGGAKIKMRRADKAGGEERKTKRRQMDQGMAGEDVRRDAKRAKNKSKGVLGRSGEGDG